MTCIVAIKDKSGNVLLGGDSAAIDLENLSFHKRTQPKVFLRKNGNKEMGFGFIDSFRMGQLLEHSLKIPEYSFAKNKSVYSYMCTDFIDAVRECFRTGGYHGSFSDGADVGGVFLVGFLGRIFQVESDFQVGEATCGYAACGSGGDIALGSLYSTRRVDLDGMFEGLNHYESRVKLALKAAAQFNAGVRAPFHLITVKG